MNIKKSYKLIAVAISLGLTAAVMMCDLGVNFTPLTKLFVIFFGGIVGLQCVPATFLFIKLFKGFFAVNQNNSLTGNGVKS